MSKSKWLSTVEKINVLWIYPHDKKCGIAGYSETLLSEFRKLSINITIEAPANNYTKLRNILLKTKQADIVHIQYDSSHWMLGKKNLFSKYATRINKPLVVTLHEIYKESPFDYPVSKIKSAVPGGTLFKRWIYKLKHHNIRTENKLCKNNYFSTAIQVHNNFQRNILINKGTKESVVHVIPHGVWKEKYINIESYPKTWRFGTFGFLNNSTDYKTVLTALSKLQINWTYTIGGGARLPEHKHIANDIKNIAKKLSIGNHVNITGYIKNESMDNFFNGLDIYIAPFKFKSSSSSLNRAVSFACPIIASDIPLVKDINKRLKFIETYKVSDNISLEKIILKLTEDLTIRKSISEKAKEYCLKYSFENEAKNIAKLYKTIKKN